MSDTDIQLADKSYDEKQTSYLAEILRVFIRISTNLKATALQSAATYRFRISIL